MSTTPPPVDPNDPRQGDPTNITAWVGLGGLAVIIVIIGTVTYWNRGGGGGGSSGATTTVSSSSGPSAPAPVLDGTYKIIFDGTATAHDDRPDGGQTYRSADATATWHLEYTYGSGHGDAVDLATSQIDGTGSSKAWRIGADCNGAQATKASYQPRSSLLRRGPEGFRVGVPLAGDLLAVPGSCAISATDPFSRAWQSTCGTGEDCVVSDVGKFWLATFTIASGQTGTVVTPIPSRTFTHVAPPGGGSENAMHQWSGTITVVAQ